VFVLDFAFGAVLFFIPSYLQEILSYDPLQAGLLLLPASVTMVVSMPIGGRLYERLGPVIPIVGGLAVAGLAMLLLGEISTTTRYSAVWPPLALLGLGIGTALTPMNLAALNSMPVRSHGSVAAIITTFGGLGSTFGVALSGALFEALQNSHTVTAAAERGVTLTSAGARELEGLLTGTPASSHALAGYPVAQHASLTAAVHEGFISALATTMQLSLALVIVSILLALLLIRASDAPPLPRPNVTEPFSGLAPRP
jgi:MFS family permease